MILLDDLDTAQFKVQTFISVMTQKYFKEKHSYLLVNIYRSQKSDFHFEGPFRSGSAPQRGIGLLQRRSAFYRIWKILNPIEDALDLPNLFHQGVFPILNISLFLLWCQWLENRVVSVVGRKTVWWIETMIRPKTKHNGNNPSQDVSIPTIPWKMGGGNRTTHHNHRDKNRLSFKPRRRYAALNHHKWFSTANAIQTAMDTLTMF